MNTKIILTLCSLSFAADQLQVYVLQSKTSQKWEKQYFECLYQELQNKNFMNLIWSDTSHTTDSIPQIHQSKSYDLILWGHAVQNPDATQFKLYISKSIALKIDTLTWTFLGNPSDLLSDACKNGSGIVYNYLSTPEATYKLQVPANTTYEKMREEAQGQGNLMKSVRELRAKEAKAKAINESIRP